MRHRLLCAGHETALLLLQLRALTPDETEKHLLTTLAQDCLASSRSVPIGTAFIQHTRWDAAGVVAGSPEKRRSAGRMGPVDSRRVATEVLSGLRLAEEFPG
jgi:hypothetical protein